MSYCLSALIKIFRTHAEASTSDLNRRGAWFLLQDMIYPNSLIFAYWDSANGILGSEQDNELYGLEIE
ncbi:hypothetical protein DRN86_01470 [Candidatus Geothermarchaeota archaeon]|nr:MAG: hypothetical protein DRN86_01470 [Candidatus Geothermarchaeota archaeon]